MSISGEECTTLPAYLAASGINRKEATTVNTLERHSRGGSIGCLNKVINNTSIARQRGVNGTHVVDKAFGTTPFGPERRSEAKVRMQKSLVLPLRRLGSRPRSKS